MSQAGLAGPSSPLAKCLGLPDQGAGRTKAPGVGCGGHGRCPVFPVLAGRCPTMRPLLVFLLPAVLCTDLGKGC